MKQIIFIFCMILMLSFCGCTNVGSNRNEYMSNWFKSEQEISDNMMKQIIDLYNEGNVKEFEKLFSQNSKKDIEDINKQISSFFEFIDGDIQEYSGDCASSSENNNGNKRIELDGMCHISTSKNEYYLNFYTLYMHFNPLSRFMLNLCKNFTYFFQKPMEKCQEKMYNIT